MVDMNLQYDDGGVIREKISLGQLPIMLKVNDVLCDPIFFLHLFRLPLIIP